MNDKCNLTIYENEKTKELYSKTHFNLNPPDLNQQRLRTKLSGTVPYEKIWPQMSAFNRLKSQRGERIFTNMKIEDPGEKNQQ